MRRLLWAAGALLAALPAPAPAQETLPADPVVRRLLADRVATGTVPGLVAGLLDADGTRRIVVAGEAGNGRPLDGGTVFEIGSITKTFTGVLLAMMAARGEVALEDPVARYLPDSVTVPQRERAITLRDLATQSSGLPRMPDNFAPQDFGNPYADYTVGRLYAFLAAHELRRAPGAAYEYSNLGMGLLGHALARRADTSYESLLIARVLGPLGMGDTRIALSGTMRQRLAPGHDQAGRVVPNWDLPTLAGAGALRSTAHDMLTWLAAHLAPPDGVLGRAITTAQEPRAPGPGRHRVALGWHVRDAGDSAVVWHNGGTGGYHSFAALVPARGVAVVVLANSSAGIDDIGWALLDPGTALRVVRAEAPVAPNRLARYAGRYDLSSAFSIWISLDDGRLFAQATGQPKLPLFASSDSTFFFRTVEAELTFVRDSTGAVDRLILHQNGRDVPGTKAR